MAVMGITHVRVCMLQLVVPVTMGVTQQKLAGGLQASIGSEAPAALRVAIWSGSRRVRRWLRLLSMPQASVARAIRALPPRRW